MAVSPELRDLVRLSAYGYFRLFDHYAHLGGAAFGIWYHTYGRAIWDTFRVTHLQASSEVRRQRDENAK